MTSALWFGKVCVCELKMGSAKWEGARPCLWHLVQMFTLAPACKNAASSALLSPSEEPLFCRLVHFNTFILKIPHYITRQGNFAAIHRNKRNRNSFCCLPFLLLVRFSQATEVKLSTSMANLTIFPFSTMPWGGQEEVIHFFQQQHFISHFMNIF